MSHFTSLKTQMVEKEYIIKGLKDLGYSPVEENAKKAGFNGRISQADFTIASGNPGYNIGFRKSGIAYEVVANWWGIRNLDQKQFIDNLFQRYAYHAAVTKLEQQGFSLVNDETQKDGKIHLVLRRMSY